MQKCQAIIKKSSIDWCLGMKFSKEGANKEKAGIGTAHWQSEHHVASTKVSLVIVSLWLPIVLFDRDDLTLPEHKAHATHAFRWIAVIWFVLIAHIFGDEDV